MAPRLATWAVRTTDLNAAVTAARRCGYDPGAVVAMSRRTTAGDLLEWRLTLPDAPLYDGLVPFLIDWGDDHTSVEPCVAAG